jgi:OTU domain-containing protein 6
MAELGDFLGVFEFADEDGAAPAESLAERHAREKQELKEKLREMKAAAPKAERPAVAAQIEALESEQRERHARELSDTGVPTVQMAGLGIAQPKKGGKGSKARSKKEKAEAEREARMAEARSNAGPAKGAIEDKQLAAQLQPLGLRVEPVAADGHCLFRAIATQLKAAQPDEQAVWELRKRAVSHIEAHAADFSPFFEPSESAPSFDGYLEQMKTSAAWGGQMELRALAQVLGRTIRVHTAGAPPVVMNDEAADAPALELSFHQHAYGLGEHYNAVGRI